VLKRGLIALTIFAIILMLVLTYITARYIDKEEISKVELERERMKSSRDSLYTVVAVKDSMQKLLQSQVIDLKSEADILKEQVVLLEERRKSEQLSVRNIRKKEDLQDTLRKVFPEMAASQWGVREVFTDDGLGIEYLLVPLWFSEKFIIDHRNAESYRKQRNKLQIVDSLRVTIVALQDSILHLERDKSMAFQAGFDSAYAKYDANSQRYLDLLKKPPQIKFGLPRWGVVAAGTATGLAAGLLINR
jgi:hypothetical protein